MNVFSWVELVSVATGIVAVWFNTRQQIYGWPLGLVSIVLASLVYWQSKLYGEFALQGFFAVSSIYGWINWYKLHHGLMLAEKKPISFASASQLLGWIGLGSFFTVLGYYILARFTDGDVIWLDSGITAFSLVAQVMLARKIIENWLIWIVIDVVSAGVYVYKGLYFMAFEFVVFCVLACWGYKQWKAEWT
jgi:nicotinamide mononucleotide transporter